MIIIFFLLSVVLMIDLNLQFDCCAVESYTEFDITVYWNRKKNINGNITKVMIPETCCKLEGDYPDQGPPYDSNCTLNATTDNSYFDKVSVTLSYSIAVVY